MFIVDVHDVPHCISPKFADDMVTVAADDDITYVEQKLQQATNDLINWSQNEGMDINVSKTKVMVFGNQTGKIDIKIHGSSVENVTSYKYLGILLDSDLNFSMHIEYAVGIAKRASAKVSRLIEGDKGVPVHTGIELYNTHTHPRLTALFRDYPGEPVYKTLVRLHLEHALPVWSSIPEKEVLKLEKVQHQCLNRMIVLHILLQQQLKLWLEYCHSDFRKENCAAENTHE